MASRALHNLRGIVIIVVVAFHSVLAYTAYAPPTGRFDDPPYSWRAFPIVDTERWFGLDLFCALQDIYLISLMFFLSGLFVLPSLKRKGVAQFLRDRVVRIAVPFALVVAFLMPLTHYPAYLVTAVDPSFEAYLRHLVALPFWPSGPPWFLWLLFLFDVAVAGAYVAFRESGAIVGAFRFLDSIFGPGRPRRFVAAILGASALAYVPLALAFGPWEWFNFGPFSFQLCRPLHYIVYFCAGMGVGAYGIDRGLLAADGRLRRRWASVTIAAAVSYVAWLGVSGLALAFPAAIGLQLLQALIFVLACGSGIMAALALALRFADRPRPALDAFSTNAYGIYLVHYFFVVWLQYLLLGAALYAIVKGLMVFAVALFVSLAAVVAICRIPAAARIIGTEGGAVAKTR
jgi:peptidoglycan/LPS O-acetylase OafA/YrhL